MESWAELTYLLPIMINQHFTYKLAFLLYKWAKSCRSNTTVSLRLLRKINPPRRRKSQRHHPLRRNRLRQNHPYVHLYSELPQFLIQAGYIIDDRKIGVVLPRKIAAISIAKRVNEELGCSNSEIAHRVRFNSTVNSNTRVVFMTDGSLVQ